MAALSQKEIEEFCEKKFTELTVEERNFFVQEATKLLERQKNGEGLFSETRKALFRMYIYGFRDATPEPQTLIVEDFPPLTPEMYGLGSTPICPVEVRNFDDVKDFFLYLKAIGLDVKGFTDFQDFVGQALPTNKEATKFNEMLDACFDVCGQCGEDINQFFALS